MALKILKTLRLPVLLPKWNNSLSITKSSRNSLFPSSKYFLSSSSANKDNKSLKNGGNKEPETIEEIVKLWSNRFENEGISEPVESIEHILAHVIGTKKVFNFFFFKYVISIIYQSDSISESSIYYIHKLNNISRPSSQYHTNNFLRYWT